jgi:hypothetical protein
MKLVVTSNPEVLEVQFAAKWQLKRTTIQAAIKSGVAMLATTGGAVLAQQLHKLGIMLGWW